MSGFMLRRWWVLLGTVYAMAAAAADAPLPRLDGLRVMVCANYMDLMNIPAVRRLQAAGAEVRPGNLGTLTGSVLAPYHLAIVVLAPKAENEGAPAALAEFVEAGGGLLVYRHFYGAEHLDTYLAPFGASMPAELIQDPSHSFRPPIGFNLTYAYTDRIAPGHPVTAGVRGLWYNAQNQFLFHTGPVTVAEPWQVLATGQPEARSLIVGGLHEEHLVKPGTYAEAPPIVAAREFGAGAIVLIGISPMEVFYGQGLPAYHDVAMSAGNGIQPSDVSLLYANALGWLADHARKAPELGQGTLTPLENGWARPSIPDWSQPPAPTDLCSHPARGVIGLHSTLSDGQATPEALIARGREAGLQWVAFTERLEAFGPEKWEQLRAICKAASTAEFAVLPGLDYQDGAGARYVVFGDFDWPPEKVFSADRQRIVEPTWWFNVNCVPNGPYDLSHSPLRYWDLSMYNCLPIRTTLAGQPVETEPATLAAFRHMQGVQDDPFPMAVEMCYTADQVAAAAGRMCNFITQDQPGDLTRFYVNHAYYASYRGFVSDGPLVTDWRAANETRITGGAWWLPGTEQYRVKLAVTATAPIVDIRIYDGPRLFRRFRPNEPRVVLFLDLPHDQQRNLTAEIVDANGKRAITGGLSIRDWLNYRFMCSDRGNSICDAVQVDEAGPYLMGPTAPYQRKMTAFGICAGYGERHFTILPPDFDGGMRPIGMQVTPRFTIDGYTWMPPGATPETRMEIPVASRDGILQDDSIVGYFPQTANAWSPKMAPQDVEGVRVRYRYLDITARAHDPGVVLVEGSLTVERPMTLTSMNVFSVFHTPQPGEGDHYALVTPETTVAGLSAGTAYHASGAAVSGSYACAFPSLWGASGAMTLDEGYVLSVGARQGSTHLNLALANLPRAMKAGETLTYRYLAMHGPSGERANTASWEEFAKQMGLRGAPAYTVGDVRVGRVRDTRFLLELEPAEYGVAATVSQANLPVRLPVRVAGMNLNWTFCWFDLERHQWFPSAVDYAIGQGYFTLDTRAGAHRFFAGHPVIADHPDVRISVLTDAKTEVRAAVNNAGDEPMTLAVRLNPALGAAAPQAVTLAPGELKNLTFPLTP